MGIESPFSLLVAIFAGGTLLWGLEARKLPVAPFWVAREDSPKLYWSSAAGLFLVCICSVVAAI